MLVVTERRGAQRGARAWVGALATAALLLILLAAPSSAATARTRLSAATVSPRSGTTTTTIVISVVYQNANGSRADSVDVKVAGADHEMARQPGGSWGKGVTFRWSGKLPAGRHSVLISATAKDNSQASLPAGSVTIAAAPAPDPTPKPTARATPKPDPTPEPTPSASSEPIGRAVPSPGSVIGPGALGIGLSVPPDLIGVIGPTATPAPSPAAGPPVTAAIIGGPGPGGPTTGGTDGSVRPGGSPAGGDNDEGRSPLGAILAIAGLQAPAFPGFGLAPTLVTTSTAVGAAMALGLFGRRRHDDDPPDDVLAAASSNGVAVASYDAMAVAVAGAAAGQETVDLELLLPRWRRPSLLQARKADPIRDSTPAPRLTFDEGLVGPLAGRERKVIRYRVVRLLDSPDELRGTEIGYLDQGDEVQLLEKYGAYWLVLAPDGQQGWLHKMTLGEVADHEPTSSERPTASMPTAADSWTMGESDIDSDVLEAYLESRRRSA